MANLYYAHPILNILADEFGVSDQRSSLIPTVLQAGYAGGLLFIVPIGDIVKRRPFILFLNFATSMLVSKVLVQPPLNVVLTDEVAWMYTYSIF